MRIISTITSTVTSTVSTAVATSVATVLVASSAVLAMSAPADAAGTGSPIVSLNSQATTAEHPCGRGYYPIVSKKIYGIPQVPVVIVDPIKHRTPLAAKSSRVRPITLGTVTLYTTMTRTPSVCAVTTATTGPKVDRATVSLGQLVRDTGWSRVVTGETVAATSTSYSPNITTKWRVTGSFTFSGKVFKATLKVKTPVVVAVYLP